MECNKHHDKAEIKCWLFLLDKQNKQTSNFDVMMSVTRNRECYYKKRSAHMNTRARQHEQRSFACLFGWSLFFVLVVDVMLFRLMVMHLSICAYQMFVRLFDLHRMKQNEYFFHQNRKRWLCRRLFLVTTQNCLIKNYEFHAIKKRFLLFLLCNRVGVFVI